MTDINTIMQMAKQQREIEALKSNQIGLGDLIKQTQYLVDNMEPDEDHTWLSFEFGSCGVTGIDSFRGYYDELALSYGDDEILELADFLGILKDALGKTFIGYKGGDFTMHEHTPIWVANYSRTSYTKVIGIERTSKFFYRILTYQD